MIIIGELINTIEQIVTAYPGIHTACGLSNISYGLPARKFMNQTFMSMAIAKGLDGAIMNPLAGRDNFCMNYLKAFRAGMFEG